MSALTHDTFEVLSSFLTGAALDAVIGIVESLAKKQETVLVLNLKNKTHKCITESSGGVRFLEALGYVPRSGFYCVKTLPSPQVLSSALSALKKGATGESYLLEKAIEESIVAAREEARAARETMRQKKTCLVPEQGMTSLRLVAHLEASTSSSQQVAERRFSPDDRLCDVIHWLACSDSKTLNNSHSFERQDQPDSSGGPYWWCHGWDLSDVTLRPSKPLTAADANKTLHALGLWPSAQLSIRVKPLRPEQFLKPIPPPPCAAATSLKSETASSPTVDNKGGYRLGGSTNEQRLKPSEYVAVATSQGRFGRETESLAPRDHFNIKGKLVRSRA